MTRITAFLLVLMTLEAPAQTLTRKIVLKKGQEFERIITTKSSNVLTMMGVEQEIINNESRYTTIRVTEVTDSGYVLENKITRKVISMQGMGQDNFFDSDSTYDTGDNLIRGKFMEEVGKVTRIALSRDGKIIMSEDTLKLEEEAAGFAAMGNLVNAVRRPGQNYELIPKLPDGTKKIGREWSDSANIDGNRGLVNYKLLSVKKHEAVISQNGTVTNSIEIESGGVKILLKTDGTVSGTVSMNPRTGILTQSTITIDATGTMEVAGQVMPMKMKMETTQSVIPRKP